MDLKELTEIVSRGEDSRNQFKEDIRNVDSLATEMVAFSNSHGGRIFIGVGNQKTLMGLNGGDVHRINQLISNAANQHVRSPIAVLTENVTITPENIVIVLTVPEGIDKPYFDFINDPHLCHFSSIVERAVEDAPITILNDLKNDLPPLSDLQINILKLIRQNNFITYEEMFSKLNKDRSTIRRNIHQLKTLSILRRVGARRKGRWEILEPVE